MQPLMIGTGGHIDHGKTSLVKALTGVDTDRLPEEKKRGITIELGFAPWRETKIAFIDVPGHEKFIHTMVAGASGIDLGLLVVAADDGVMPQTREHLAIFQLLDIPKLVIAITKCDKVEKELIELVRDEISELLSNTKFANSTMIETGILNPQSIETLEQTLLHQAQFIPFKNIAGTCVLPLDRAFHVEGHGSVITGTLLTGELKSTTKVTYFSPNGKKYSDLRIRSMESFGKQKTEAQCGQRVALNLAGKESKHLQRGGTLVSNDYFESTHALLAKIHWIISTPPLFKSLQVQVNIGGQELTCKCIPLEYFVLIKFQSPLFSYAGQPIILRQNVPGRQSTIGGGRVEDPLAFQGKGSLRENSILATLRFHATKQELPEIIARMNRSKGTNDSEFQQRIDLNFPIETLSQHESLIQYEPHRYLSKEILSEKLDVIVTQLKNFHHKHPFAWGMSKASLISKQPPIESKMMPSVFEIGVQEKKVEQTTTEIRLHGAERTFDTQTQSMLATLQERIEKSALQTPFLSELCTDFKCSEGKIRSLLSFLREQNHIVAIQSELFCSSFHIESLEKKVISYFQQNQELSPQDFKNLAGGLSRKWAIAYLEYFDAKNITRRQGNTRVIFRREQERTSTT